MGNGSSVLEGIAAYKARRAEQEARREAANKPSVNRLNLEKDGDSVLVRFVQEIDPDAKHYSEKNGLGFVNIEHKHPDPKRGWRNRANCTTESQGACYACDRVQDSTVDWDKRKGWKQKERLYINVVAGAPREVTEKVNGKEVKKFYATDVDTKTGDGEVYLIDQSTWKGIWDQLLEEAVDEETILANYWKITKKGDTFNTTSYLLSKKSAVPKGAKDVEEFEVVNIKDDVLNEVPYAQQEAFYHRGIDAVQESAPVEEETQTSSSEKW